MAYDYTQVMAERAKQQQMIEDHKSKVVKAMNSVGKDFNYQDLLTKPELRQSWNLMVGLPPEDESPIDYRKYLIGNKLIATHQVNTEMGFIDENNNGIDDRQESPSGVGRVSYGGKTHYLKNGQIMRPEKGEINTEEMKTLDQELGTPAQNKPIETTPSDYGELASSQGNEDISPINNISAGINRFSPKQVTESNNLQKPKLKSKEDIKAERNNLATTRREYAKLGVVLTKEEQNLPVEEQQSILEDRLASKPQGEKLRQEEVNKRLITNLSPKLNNFTSSTKDVLRKFNQLDDELGFKLDDYKDQDIPGVTIAGYRFSTGEKSEKLKSVIQGIYNAKLYDSSGKQINETEFKRILDEMGVSKGNLFSSEKTMIEALRRYKQNVIAKYKDGLVSFPEIVLKEYERRTGSPMSGIIGGDSQNNQNNSQQTNSNKKYKILKVQ